MTQLEEENHHLFSEIKRQCKIETTLTNFDMENSAEGPVETL